MRTPLCVLRRLTAVLLLFLAACAGSTRGRLIEHIANRDISEREVRAEVNQHLLRYSGMVEFTAFQVLSAQEDPGIRMAILYWQINGISACRGAAFLDDPLVAAIDCWVLGLQELAFLESEDAKQLFGSSRPLVLDGLKRVHGFFQAAILARTKNPEEMKAKVEAFVAKHPLTNLSFARDSVAPVMAELVGDPNLSTFAALGTLDERIQDISERLNVYAQQVPKQVLWSADLFREQMSQNEQVQTLIQDVHDINASLARLSRLDERLPEIIQDQVDQGMEGFSATIEPALQALESERDLAIAAVTKEREQLFAEVDRQRLDTLEFVEKERQAIERTLAAQVVELSTLVDRKDKDLESLMGRTEKLILADMQDLTRISVEQADSAAESRIHQLAWSLLAVGAGLLFILFLLRAISVRWLS